MTLPVRDENGEPTYHIARYKPEKPTGIMYRYGWMSDESRLRTARPIMQERRRYNINMNNTLNIYRLERPYTRVWHFLYTNKKYKCTQ